MLVLYAKRFYICTRLSEGKFAEAGRSALIRNVLNGLDYLISLENGSPNSDRESNTPIKCIYFGEMAEWSNALVLKTSEGHTSGGSNPSFSA